MEVTEDDLSEFISWIFEGRLLCLRRCLWCHTAHSGCCFSLRLTEEELTYMIAVSESTPGPISLFYL